MSNTRKKIIVGASYLLSEKLVKLVIGLVVHALVARYLSPARFGKMGYIINLATAFLPVTLLGLDEIGIRKIVHREASVEGVVSDILSLRLVAFFGVGIFSGIFLAFFMGDEDPSYRLLAWSFCLVYNFLGCLYTLELPFLSEVTNRPLFMSRLSGYGVGTGLKLLAVFQNFGFKFILSTYIVEELISRIILARQLVKQLSSLKLRFQLNSLATYVKPSIWIVLGTFFMTLENKIGFLVMDELASPKALGFYTAAFMLVDLWTFVPLALISALLPSVLELYLRKREDYVRRIEDIHGLFFLVEVGFVTSVWIVAPILVKALYGLEYAGAEEFLRWQSLTVFVTFTQLLRLRKFLIEDRLKLWAFMTGTQFLLTLTVVYGLSFGTSLSQIVIASLASFLLTSFLFSIVSNIARRSFLEFVLGFFFLSRTTIKLILQR